MMRRYTSWILALLFYASLLTWSFGPARAEYFNINAKSVTGDGTGNISGFDNLTLTGNITGDNTGNLTGFDNATFTGRTTTATLTVTGTPTFVDNTINGADLLDNTVTSAKIQDNTIALSKIAHTGTASSSTFLRGDAAWATTTQLAVAAYKNLRVTTPADSQSVTITADKVIAVDNNDVLRVLSTVSLTVDLDVAGANGLDTGTIAANTGYFLYVIDNGATTAGLASTSATAPTMPSGYTYKALVGWCTTDATATPFNIEEFTQIDDIYSWTTKQKVIDSAGSTTTTAINLAAGGALAWATVPPTITKGVFGKVMNNTNAGAVFIDPLTFSDSIGTTNSQDTSATEFSAMLAQNVSSPFSVMALQESQKFYYQVSANTVDLWISGFTLKR